ncbi:hypothetical protein D1114_22875 [Cereibacter sphaeroides]|uniref:Uncharacterized protein n=1 Tax=Cereibacter sphaeroides TaxID=1063 RepID=A0AAX1UES0_CERSP|nr:hypothetical protein [Cereibacter sphaeroides]RHZ90515.1 hypothetical protein D1114_22875 [Cereibacter sphaeroides]
MSASVIGALRVNLGLDSAEFQTGLKKAQGSLGLAARSFLAFSAMGATAGAALTGIVAPTARVANEISRLSQVANTTPEALQRWSAGARTVGVEQEKLADILKDVNDKVGDFLSTGGGEMKDFFEQIAPKVGVTADQFRNLSGPQALQLYVSSIEKAGVSQAEMTFYMEAIANDATLLLPLLKGNGAEMDRLGVAAAGLGSVLGDEAVEALRRTHLALGQVSTAVAGARDRMAADLAPAVEAMALSFTASMQEGGALRTVLDGLGTVAAGAAQGLMTLADHADILASGLVGVAATAVPGLVASLATMTSGMGIATLATTALTGALGALRTAIAIAGGPWGILAGAIASAAAYFLVFRDNAGLAETAAYHVRDAELALRGELEAYATASSPAAREESRKRVIAHYEQAKAALTAAEAELALAEAMGEDIKPGSLMDQAGPEEGSRSLDARREKVRELTRNVREMAEAVKQVTVTGGGGATVIPAPKAVAATTAEVKKLGGAGKKAGQDMKEGMTEAEAAAKRLADTLATNVSQAINSLVDGAVDWMLDGFRGGFRGLLDLGKETVRELMALFLKNSFTVRVGLGVSGGWSAGGYSLAGTSSGGGGGLGLLGNIGGAVGNFIGGITGPLQAGLSAAMQGGLSAGVQAWTASMNASAAGVFGGASALGTIAGSLLGGAAIGGFLSGGYSLIGKNPSITSGLGAGIGFLAGGPIGALIGGAVGGVANALFGRKLKDSGLEGRYVDGTFSGNTYQFYKGGVFRSNKTKRKALDPEMQAALDETLDAMRIDLGGMGALLGGAGDALEGFSTSFKFSTKGMNAEQAQAALEAQLGRISDAMVAQIFGTKAQVTDGNGIFELLRQRFPGMLGGVTKTVYKLSDEFEALQVTGETATETLTRLAGALSSANVWMDRLGKADFAGSLAGGGEAWDFAEVFGGTEAMNEAVAAYYGAFYSDGERLAQARKELSEALNLLGIDTLPGSSRAFRDLVDAAFGAGDEELAAKLIQLAPAMAAITDQTEALTSALKDLDRQSLFATRAEALYAATAEGHRLAAPDAGDPQVRALLGLLIAAVREGDINNARLTSRLLAVQERASLDPAA